jgi:predicted nucleic acid-binding protein
MFHAPFKVILDANVIYPFSLRDTLLRAAAAGFFQVYWSAQILDEARRNLVSAGRMTEEQAMRLRIAMDGAFPEAMVTGHEPLIGAMQNDEKDRHVAAAAVKAGAQVIVTANLKDFRHLPEGIEAQSPDDFLCNLLDLDPEGMVEVIGKQAADLTKPATTVEALLNALEKTVPNFVVEVRAHRANI